MSRYNPLFFDKEFYRTSYPDVAKNWEEPIEEHYFAYGSKEGRSPSSWFDVAFIRATYRDLEAMTAEQVFAHYNRFGWREGRVTSPAFKDFDSAKYLASYRDLGAGGITQETALSHYLAFGQYEGRVAYKYDGSAIGTSAPGLLKLLTKDADRGPSFSGGPGSDLFGAVRGGPRSTENTLTDADALDGGPGIDTLTITVTATDSDVLGGASIRNIEQIVVRGTPANQTARVDLAGTAGVRSVSAELCQGSSVFVNLPTGSTVGMVGDGRSVTGPVTFRYTIPSDDVTLTFSGGTRGGDITNAPLGVTSTKKATVNSTGPSGVVNLVGLLNLDENKSGDLSTLIVNAERDLRADLDVTDYPVSGADLLVNGAGKVDLGSGGIFKSIDATKSGGLTITLDTKTQSFKGSDSPDVVTTDALATQSAGMIDGRQGEDTLIIAAVGHVASQALGNAYVNFEKLVNRAPASVDIQFLIGITSLETAASGSGFINMTSGLAENIVVTADQSTLLKFALNVSGPGDVIGITMGSGNGPATSVRAGGLDVTGFEALKLTANPGESAGSPAQKTSTISSIIGPNLKSIDLSGSSFEISLQGKAAAGGKGEVVPVAVNAATLTGDGSSTTAGSSKGVTLRGALVPGSSVVGSDFVDTFDLDFSTATTQHQSIYSGAGNDSITIKIAGGTISSGSVTVAGGRGKDLITIVGDSSANADPSPNTIIRIAEGDSAESSYDEVTGVALSTPGKQAFSLDFDGSARRLADQASPVNVPGLSPQLTYTSLNGMFSITGSSVALIDKIAAAKAIASSPNTVCGFRDGADTFVFHKGSQSDSLVKLVGVAVLGLDQDTAGFIDIA